MNISDSHIGHRARLRERFLKNGRSSLADYELLELLLSYAIPRKDTKLIAKELIATFGNFAAVFDQPAEKLQTLSGIGPSVATFLISIRAVMTRYLEQKAERADAISSPEDVADFVRLAIGASQRECLMVLCLNAANRLVHHEILVEGTVDQAPVYPREIFRPALLHNATAMILVHNHPSGRAIPSEQDQYMTQRIDSLASEFNIVLHDHLIVCPSQAYSIKTGRLL
ncbi:MAG: DNA repair protein RadC [bacterium]|nr:DNA repair protein RadC [bacterium]